MTQASDSPTKTNPHVFLLAGEAEGAPGLRAAQCRDCGGFTPGRVSVCAHCLSRNVTEVAAGQSAHLVDFSIAHVPAGGFEAPYAIGQILTGEGMTLFAPLAGDLSLLAPGAALSFATIEHGDGQIGFAYRPERKGSPI